MSVYFYKKGTAAYDCLKSKGKEVEIVSIEEINEKNTSCNVITNKHLNMFTNGVLTTWAFNNLYPIQNMKYQKVQNDTFTSEELKDIPEKLIEGLRLNEISVDLMEDKQKTLDSIKENVEKLLNSEQKF